MSNEHKIWLRKSLLKYIFRFLLFAAIRRYPRGYTALLIIQRWIIIKNSADRPVVRSMDTDEDLETLYLKSAKDGSPEERFSEEQIRKDISDALAMLPDEQRQVVMLRDVYGFSYEQITVMTGLKSGTLKSRLSRGRSGVKNILIKMWNNPT